MEILTLLFTEHKTETIIGITAIIWIILEFIFSSYKKVIKKRLLAQFENVPEREYADFDTQYYRESQAVDIIRIGLLILICLTVLLFQNSSSFSFFAITTGAILVIFKDTIISFFTFFLILPLYKVGETISIGAIQGEIIYVRPLFVGIIGKDDYGEHLGQLYIIPNYKFLTEIVKKEELKIDSYKIETLDIYYTKEDYKKEFGVFFALLEDYLESVLPMRGIKKVGFFKSFAGYRYKMRIETKEKYIIIKISFIGKPEKLLDIKTQILNFADGEKCSFEKSEK